MRRKALLCACFVIWWNYIISAFIKTGWGSIYLKQNMNESGTLGPKWIFISVEMLWNNALASRQCWRQFLFSLQGVSWEKKKKRSLIFLNTQRLLRGNGLLFPSSWKANFSWICWYTKMKWNEIIRAISTPYQQDIILYHLLFVEKLRHYIL